MGYWVKKLPWDFNKNHTYNIYKKHETLGKVGTGDR